MSQLLAHALTYETVVAEFFLGLRGAGLMLSPLDEEQVRLWNRRGLPVAVVCRGLRRGLEDAASRSPATPRPRSLRAFRQAVEAEWRGYRDGCVGDAPGRVEVEAAAALRRVASARALLASAASASPGGPCAEAHRAGAAALEQVSPLQDLYSTEEALARVDELLVRAWLTALPQPFRAVLGVRCRLRAGPRPAGTRRGAYRECLRAHLLDGAREAGLLCLRGAV